MSDRDKINCRHCGSLRTRFIRTMVNTHKYTCDDCKKNTYIRKVPLTPRFHRGPNMSAKVVAPPSNAYTVFNHQNKGARYVEALTKYAEFEFLEEDHRYQNLRFALTDNDIMGRQHKLAWLFRNGCRKFFVIPHTARPNIVADIMPGWEHTTAQFVVSQGHVEVMRRFGYSKPLHPVGWTMCPIKKYKPRPAPRKVLFGPIHPRCSKVDQDVNAETFKRLYKLAKAGDIELTVRFINNLHQSGLQQVEHPNVTYTAGRMDQGYEQIDNADVVVGHQTFAWIAVARGVPTVMMAEDMPTHIQKIRKAVQYAPNWDKYADLLAYPLDILATKDTLNLLTRAVRDDKEIQDWRTRMIGTPFRARRFVEIIQSYL